MEGLKVKKKIITEEKRDFKQCVEKKLIKVTGGEKVTEVLPLVIPLKPNTLITAEKLKQIAEKVESAVQELEIKEEPVMKEERIEENETLDQIAIWELMQEARKDVKVEVPDSLAIPMPSKPVLTGEKESTLDDYDMVPIQQFGSAMLRGMGWTPSKDGSKYKQPELCPKSLSLGVEKIIKENQKKQSKDKTQEELVIVKNSFVKITTGKYSGYYGKVVSFDEDNGRVMVDIAVKKETISLSEFMMHVVTKSEYDKESKVVNAIEDVTNSKRTRGPQRGIGVRVRDGNTPPTVVVEEVLVVARERGGRSRCGKRRGGRAKLRGPHEQPRPRTFDELLICDIMEIPDGKGLDPLHSKRMRMWQPSNLAPAPPPPPSPPSASTFTSQEYDEEVVEEAASVSPVAEIAPPLSPACSVPWPVMFVECRGRGSAPSTPPASPMQHPPPRARQNLSDEYIAPLINFGSEAGSDESDDDDDLVYPFIPRVYRSTLETPMDLDEDHAVAFDQPTAGDLAVAGNPALASGPVPAGDPAPASVPPTATDQPWRWYDFQWRAFPDSTIPPESRRETFSESNVGPRTPCVDPYDIFVAIWDRQIMDHIASETNKYAQQVTTQMFDNHTLHPNSRIRRWRDTTVDELYVYFGLILAMGIVVKSRLEEYWSATPDIFYTPGFSAHMSINRFLLINKCLHFSDNEYMCALNLVGSEAKLYKMQPVLSHLNMKFQSLYTPKQNIALDESLLQWKGLLDINQLIPNKAASVGIKTYEICESQTGYLWRFEVHGHKKSPPQQFEDPLEAPTPSIVLRLIQGLEHKGYTMWMDNFYNSPCLARRLKSLGFDCVGTLRTDRKFVPQALHGLTKRNMRPGQITGLTSGDVDVMVWRDNNRVSMISTYHGDSQQAVRGSTKPMLILDYNIMMGGVDKKDQMLAMYPIERKRTKVWYKKLFRRLLNVSVLNSYIIHNHTSSLTHRNFRIALVKSLLSKHLATPLRPVTTQNQRIDVTHRLAEYPFVNHQRQRRVCNICKKRVHTFCVGCSKTVCIDPCFHNMHS